MRTFLASIGIGSPIWRLASVLLLWLLLVIHWAERNFILVLTRNLRLWGGLKILALDSLLVETNGHMLIRQIFCEVWVSGSLDTLPLAGLIGGVTRGTSSALLKQPLQYQNFGWDINCLHCLASLRLIAGLLAITRPQSLPFARFSILSSFASILLKRSAWRGLETSI
jgi:hypothetical protein